MLLIEMFAFLCRGLCGSQGIADALAWMGTLDPALVGCTSTLPACICSGLGVLHCEGAFETPLCCRVFWTTVRGSHPSSWGGLGVKRELFSFPTSVCLDGATRGRPFSDLSSALSHGKAVLWLLSCPTEEPVQREAPMGFEGLHG